MEMLDDLLQEVEARERTSSYACGSNKRRSKEPGSAAMLLLKSNVVWCFCNKSYQSEDWQGAKAIEDRKQAIKRSGCCFICLRKGHISRECRSKMKCSKCNGKHHTIKT